MRFCLLLPGTWIQLAPWAVDGRNRPHHHDRQTCMSFSALRTHTSISLSRFLAVYSKSGPGRGLIHFAVSWNKKKPLMYFKDVYGGSSRSGLLTDHHRSSCYKGKNCLPCILYSANQKHKSMYFVDRPHWKEEVRTNNVENPSVSKKHLCHTVWKTHFRMVQLLHQSLSSAVVFKIQHDFPQQNCRWGSSVILSLSWQLHGCKIFSYTNSISNS